MLCSSPDLTTRGILNTNLQKTIPNINYNTIMKSAKLDLITNRIVSLPDGDLQYPDTRTDIKTNETRASVIQLATRMALQFTAAMADHWNIEHGIRFTTLSSSTFTDQSWTLARRCGAKEGMYNMRLRFYHAKTESDKLSGTSQGIALDIEYSDAELEQAGFWSACDKSGLTDHLAAIQKSLDTHTVAAVEEYLSGIYEPVPAQ
jgi:hypothetical protein